MSVAQPQTASVTTEVAPAPPKGIVPILTMLVALGPLSTDMYLPSLPSLVRVFGSTVPTVQLTLSVFLVGFAFGQLAYGPLSDRFGRKPVILGGLAMFALGSALCAVSPSIEALVVARFLQAIGACSGPVLGRAVARDAFGREQAAKVLAIITAAMSVAPAVAPVVGGWLDVLLGWWSNFAALAVFAMVLLTLVRLRLPETNRHRDPTAMNPRRIIANYASLFRVPSYFGYVLAMAFGYSGLFSFISGSSFVLIEVYGVPTEQFGLYFACVVLGYFTGTMIASRLTTRLGIDRMVLMGLSVAAVAGIVMAVLACSGLNQRWGLGVAGIIGPMIGVIIGIGLMMPNAIAGAVGPFPKMAGVASALLGFVQMAVASLVGIGVAHFFDGSERPMAISVGLMQCLALGGYYMLAWRRRPKLGALTR